MTKTPVTPEVFTKDKEHSVLHFLLSEGMKEAENHQQLAAKYRQNSATVKCV
jgi:hypothetical protein